MIIGTASVFAQVQDERVPHIEEAQEVFAQGIDAFERQRYELAYEYFRRAHEDYPLHRRSTAALLMAGKALYRDEQYARAAEVLTRLIDEYPSSGYLDEARQVRDFARMQQEGEEAQVLQLGLVLPLQDDDATFSQAFFNGVHLAVQEANESGEHAVRMMFRDTEDNPDRARRVVQELAEAGADVIVGPLYSREAQAAARAAEEAGVVLLTPLATDEAVGRGRQYVFQANPTISMRGRIMARYAQDELGLRSFGVVAERDNGVSERMAEGFQQEVVEEGGDLRFFHLLENSRGWATMTDEVGQDYFTNIDALYLPISGSNAQQSIRSALNSLDRVDTPARVLGNSEWHDRNIERAASRYVTTYTNDFYVDETRPEVAAFVEQYANEFQETPDQLTFTSRRMVYAGYDLATFLLDRYGRGSSGNIRQAIQGNDTFEGLGTRIRFGQGNVNEVMFFHRYRDGRVERLE